MNSSNNEVVVAVMGVTGSGKSTFIRNVAENKAIYVGHGLDSGTSEVQPYKFNRNGVSYVLVDTPGFNDTNDSDEEIMNRVLTWLESSFCTGTRLNGILYLHRIIDPKMQGSALQNARMFRQLCGPDCFKNIFLGTTFWGNVPAGVGEQREQELKRNPDFWGAMIQKGSQVVRLENNREDGLRILEQMAKKEKITLQSQQELVIENKSHQETAAARFMNEEFLKQKHELERKLAEEQRRNQLQMERADRRRRERAARERERLRREDEERERQRVLEEEREWKAEQEAVQERLELERNRRAELRRAQQRIERTKREQQAEQARAKARLQEEKEAYYRNYQCAWYEIQARNCSKCDTYVKKGFHFYHCCFCQGDNYFHCYSCGSSCGASDHPPMKTKLCTKKEDGKCIAM